MVIPIFPFLHISAFFSEWRTTNDHQREERYDMFLNWKTTQLLKQWSKSSGSDKKKVFKTHYYVAITRYSIAFTCIMKDHVYINYTHAHLHVYVYIQMISRIIRNGGQLQEAYMSLYIFYTASLFLISTFNYVHAVLITFLSKRIRHLIISKHIINSSLFACPVVPFKSTWFIFYSDIGNIPN